MIIWAALPVLIVLGPAWFGAGKSLVPLATVCCQRKLASRLSTTRAAAQHLVTTLEASDGRWPSTQLAASCEEGRWQAICLSRVSADAGNLAKRAKLPQITGNVLGGLLCGPSFLMVLTPEALESLIPIEQGCLAIIALAAGAEVTLGDFNRNRRQVWESLSYAGLRVQQPRAGWLQLQQVPRHPTGSEVRMYVSHHCGARLRGQSLCWQPEVT